MVKRFKQPERIERKRITKLAFRERFTIAEKVGFEIDAQTNMTVKVILDDLKSATYVDLDNANTSAGLDAFISFGLLTAERKNEILGAEVQEHERFV